MDVREEIARAAERCTRREFVDRYGYPFLAIRVEIDEGAAEFRTLVSEVSPEEITPAPSPSTALVGEMLAPVRKRPGANQFSFITIGRAANNDVVVALNSVSKCHAVITPRDGGYTVADAGSKNGTVLNGRRLAANEPVAIANGDTLALSGRVTITFMDPVTTYVWLRSVAQK